MPRPCAAEIGNASPSPSSWKSWTRIVAHRVIDLVDREEQRLAGRAQLLRELVIDRGQAGAAVDDEHERVGLVDRAHRLAMDAGADDLGARPRDRGRRYRRCAARVPK